MPKSSVKASTVEPESSRQARTTGALIDQWAQSMTCWKASSTVRPMPASSCWALPTTKGPPASAPLARPMKPPFSTTMTLLPARAASTAAHMPEAPAPAITTSASRVSEMGAADSPPFCSSASATEALAATVAAAAVPRATKVRRVRSEDAFCMGEASLSVGGLALRGTIMGRRGPG